MKDKILCIACRMDYMIFCINQHVAHVRTGNVVLRSLVESPKALCRFIVTVTIHLTAVYL